MTRYTLGLDETGSGRAALDWLNARSIGDGDVVEVVTVMEMSGETTKHAGERLDDAVDVLRTSHPGAEVVKEYIQGPTVEQLVAEASSGDLLVIGAHRERVLASLFTGWRPQRIAHSSLVPTIVVPDDWAWSDGDVVVGVHTAADEQTAEAAVRLGERAGRRIRLLTARPTPSGSTSPHATSGRSDGATAIARTSVLLENIASRLRHRHASADIVTELVDGTAQSVLGDATIGASLVVIGREHLTTAGGALFGAVGNGLLRSMRVPICIVPTNAAPAEDTR
jgi:nucleotide-binding universal stress UspA family protein